MKVVELYKFVCLWVCDRGKDGASEGLLFFLGVFLCVKVELGVCG